MAGQSFKLIMSLSAVNRYIRFFLEAFQNLSTPVPMGEIEGLGMLVHQSMEHGRRSYHTSDHIFELCRGLNARQTLAALFHDVVYIQLDDGFPQQAKALFEPIAFMTKNGVRLRAIADDDRGMQLCLGIFGFDPAAMPSPHHGLNEFLSAVLAVRMLSPHLSAIDMLAVVAGIEATIPFRGPSVGGVTVADQLLGRLQKTCAALNIPLTLAEQSSIIAEAVHLANQDVAGFASTDPAIFLAGTWKLIEESNAPLAETRCYSILDYRYALVRMENFLAGLKPERVFRSYQDTPDAASFAGMQYLAKCNIKFAVAYLRAKLASVAVIEAMARVTGGDAPLSMFLGDHTSSHPGIDRIEDFLPPALDPQIFDAELMQVFVRGSDLESGFDLSASTLTAYLCDALGNAGIAHLGEQARLMFNGQLAPQDFLNNMPGNARRAIAGACARIALSRAEALQKIALN